MTHPLDDGRTYRSQSEVLANVVCPVGFVMASVPLIQHWYFLDDASFARDNANPPQDVLDLQ